MRLYSKWSCCLFFFIFLMSSITHAAENTESPIVIGATVSLEGRYQEPSVMIQKAFKFWVDRVNKGHGLLGRKVKLILYNDKSDRELTKILYKKLIAEDKVDLVFSPYGTPLTLAASEVSEEHNMLMLGVAAGSEKPWQRGARYLFQLYAPAQRQFIGLLDLMARKNCKTLSVIYDDTSDYNVDTVNGIKEWAKIFNIDIVYQKAYQDGKKDLPALLKEVKVKDAKGLILSAYSRDCYELLHLLGEMRYRPAVLAMPIAPVHPDFQNNAGNMANHVFGPSQWEPDGRIPFPGTRRFVNGFTQFTGHMPSYHAASAFSACQLYEQAITRTESINNQKLRDYITALDTVTVLGRFKVDSTGKQVGHNSFIIQWQNGKKEIVWPKKMQTASPLF
jgi:branched-chain amino acid transport system substrate-binding protein